MFDEFTVCVSCLDWKCSVWTKLHLDVEQKQIFTKMAMRINQLFSDIQIHCQMTTLWSSLLGWFIVNSKILDFKKETEKNHFSIVQKIQ